MSTSLSKEEKRIAAQISRRGFMGMGASAAGMLAALGGRAPSAGAAPERKPTADSIIVENSLSKIEVAGRVPGPQLLSDQEILITRSVIWRFLPLQVIGTCRRNPGIGLSPNQAACVSSCGE